MRLFLRFVLFQFKRKCHSSVFTGFSELFCASFPGTWRQKQHLKYETIYSSVLPHSLCCDLFLNQTVPVLFLLLFLVKALKKKKSFSHITGLPGMMAQPKRKITSRALQKIDHKKKNKSLRAPFIFFFAILFLLQCKKCDRNLQINYKSLCAVALVSISRHGSLHEHAAFRPVLPDGGRMFVNLSPRRLLRDPLVGATRCRAFDLRPMNVEHGGQRGDVEDVADAVLR